jgi:glycerophosphoryl diester phosphodiesterase
LPRPAFGIGEDGRLAPLARGGLRVLHAILPALVDPLLSVSRSTALVLHHSAVSPTTVRRAHARGAAVVTWTVDDPAELMRVEHAGVDAVVTNDPRIFVSTLDT